MNVSLRETQFNSDPFNSWPHSQVFILVHNTHMYVLLKKKKSSNSIKEIHGKDLIW